MNDLLIYDRTQADVNYIASLKTKEFSGMTADEQAYYLRGDVVALYCTDGRLTCLDGDLSCRNGIIRGACNAVDLNRVEDWTAYLADYLTARGYGVTIEARAEVPEYEYSIYQRDAEGNLVEDEYGENIEIGVGIIPAHTEWIAHDMPTRADIDRIRSNVDALQDTFAALPEWHEIIYNNTVSYTQANALEWDLNLMYTWLEAMVAATRLRQAGTLFLQAGGILN